MQFALVLAITVASASLLFAVPLQEPSTKPATVSNTVGHDIIDGNCSNVVLNSTDMVFSDYVHLTRIPLFTRHGKSQWHGDFKIYCIEAFNQKSEATGGTANVTEGGVGHNFVTVEMDSFVSHGIEFYIYIWAK